MTLVQMKNEIHHLPQTERLQLLSWLAEYICEHFSTSELLTRKHETNTLPARIRLEDIEHPLKGTLLKYDDIYEPVAVDDWNILPGDIFSNFITGALPCAA